MLDSLSGLFDIVYPIVFSFVTLGIFTLSVAECAVTDALVFALDSKAAEDDLAFFGLKFIHCTMYPATSNALVVSGKHKISHNKTSVINVSRAGFVS